LKSSNGVGRSLKCVPERAGHHLLEAQRQRTVHRTGFDGLACEEQRRRSGRAIVVHVRDRDARHADAIERLLSGRGVAVDIPDIRLLHVRIRDAGVIERIDGGGGAHHVVRLARARLRERNDPDPCHEDLLTHRCSLLRGVYRFPQCFRRGDALN
jgi:hypothetical protein